MSIHSAPRVIRIGKVFSNPKSPANSLIAGCISAIWLSRVFVCTILSDTHKIGNIRSRNFYDDITSRVTAKAGEIAETLAEYGCRLAGNIAGARLNYSRKKTVVVASSNALARQIVKILEDKYNIVLKAARTTRDLGLDAGGGTRRTTAVSQGRVVKGVSTLVKTRALVKANRAAARVIRTWG